MNTVVKCVCMCVCVIVALAEIDFHVGVTVFCCDWKFEETAAPPKAFVYKDAPPELADLFFFFPVFQAGSKQKNTPVHTLSAV